MKRRKFIQSSIISGIASTTMISSTFSSNKKKISTNNFSMNFSPKLGIFDNHAPDPVDQVQFIADSGFNAVEDSKILDRPKELQDKIVAKVSQTRLQMGSFLSYLEVEKPTFVLDDPSFKEYLKKQMNTAVETAKRINTKWTTIIAGAAHPGIDINIQTANVIENFKICAEICEKANLTIVIEPLNRLKDVPGIFLSKISKAYQICQAVDSPYFKILDDLYHQQVTEGNLINNLDMAWDKIGYIQVGDCPGRNEPGTGEINFKNIFKYLKSKGYKDPIGLDHGKSMEGKEGEIALINAYKECSNF